jgi:alpha-1,2-mannosyltransferase
MADFGVLLFGLMVAFSALALALLFWVVICRTKFRRPKKKGRAVVAFFHPHCSAGGGGERVLWKAIQVLGELHEQGFPLIVVIYTTDEPKASYRKGP